MVCYIGSAVTVALRPSLAIFGLIATRIYKEKKTHSTRVQNFAGTREIDVVTTAGKLKIGVICIFQVYDFISDILVYLEGNYD